MQTETANDNNTTGNEEIVPLHEREQFLVGRLMIEVWERPDWNDWQWSIIPIDEEDRDFVGTGCDCTRKEDALLCALSAVTYQSIHRLDDSDRNILYAGYPGLTWAF